MSGQDFRPYNGSEALRELEAYNADGGLEYLFHPGTTRVLCRSAEGAGWVRDWFLRSRARGDFPQDATFEPVGGDTPEVQCTIRYAVV